MIYAFDRDDVSLSSGLLKFIKGGSHKIKDPSPVGDESLNLIKLKAGGIHYPIPPLEPQSYGVGIGKPTF